jgi:hypothetical protein
MKFTPEQRATLMRELEHMIKVIDVVEEQANDEGLWFEAKTAPEAYLQNALRRLHATIEGMEWPPAPTFTSSSPTGH